MLSFATEFPINPSRSTDDFLQAIVTWVSGSPHTKLSPEKLGELQEIGKLQNDKASVIRDKNETIEALIASSADMELAGVQYRIIQDNGLDWLTTAVFSKKKLRDAWLGIRIECESRHPTARLPSPKKPVLVQTVLESLGSAADGPLPVSNSAYWLNDIEIELAAKLISGDAGCRLPIIYVSSAFLGDYILRPNQLASTLSGLAHVVVEPNRPFSARLRFEVDSKNVYGGTVGIYWPEGGGRRAFFLGEEYSTAGKLASAIYEEVRSALVNRRPQDRCTWAYVRETASRQAIEALKESGSQEIDEYIKVFGQEIEAKGQRLQEAESEIERLRRELRSHEFRTDAGALLRSGCEQDFYQDEVLSILLAAIKDAISHVPKDSRRQHILKSILDANCLERNVAEDYRNALKRLLKGTKTVDTKTRRELEQMGFAVSEEGKHFKLVFQGDDRYTYTLPKSGSDWRGGLNAASDIAKLLF